MRGRRGRLKRKGTGNDMSESYVINEKRELILDRVKEFIYQNGGVVKKSQLNELGIPADSGFCGKGRSDPDQERVLCGAAE